jgi:hypothetical protein
LALFSALFSALFTALFSALFTALFSALLPALLAQPRSLALSPPLLRIHFFIFSSFACAVFCD